MNNIVSYAKEHMESFDVRPLNRVDSLILSELSYFQLPKELSKARGWRGVRLAELFRAECFEQMFDGVWDGESCRQLLTALSASPRFRDIHVMGYREQSNVADEKQFAAVTFRLSKRLFYVAFRGTDATPVGWKEDFNMAVRCPVPSQESAYRYADSILDRTKRFLSAKESPGIMIGGHSKGGNMAVYAAMQITQSDLEATNERAQRLGLLPALGGSVPGRNCRISRIFSHDGPGMPQVMVHSRAYQAIAARIDKTVPESSIIGMLLQSQIKPTFVKADAISILQHMGSSWQVTQSGEFERASELTGGAQLISKTIDGWFDRVSQGQRERAINQIYDIFAAAGYGNIADLVANWTNSLPKIVAAARGTDVETRELIKDVLKAIPASAAKVAVGELRNDKDGDA